MKKVIKISEINKFIIIVCIFISFKTITTDIDCAYKNEGRLCNYQGFPGGQCLLGNQNDKSSYCGDTGESCFCSKPDYVTY